MGEELGGGALATRGWASKRQLRASPAPPSFTRALTKAPFTHARKGATRLINEVEEVLVACTNAHTQRTLSMEVKKCWSRMGKAFFLPKSKSCES